MQYLEKNEQDLVEKNLATFNKILKNSLKIKDEEILIVSDYGTDKSKLALMLSYGYYIAAQKRKLKVNFLIQDVKKGFMQADNHVRRAILGLKPGSIILVNVSNKLGRFGDKKSFRKYCREQGHRFTSASGLGDGANSNFLLFVEAMNINYRRMRKMGERIKKKWDRAKKIRVTTELGTDFTVDVEEMEAIANVGEYNHSGAGGNMPAGEVYIAPKGFVGVNGKILLDGSIRHEKGSKLLSAPVTLNVVDGRIISMEGPEANILEETFQKFENRAKYPARIRQVGELGIGINPGAVLMGLALIDEKVAGTAHVGIGSNSWFGGAIKTIFHGDMTFKNPKFFIDGKEMKL